MGGRAHMSFYTRSTGAGMLLVLSVYISYPSSSKHHLIITGVAQYLRSGRRAIVAPEICRQHVAKLLGATQHELCGGLKGIMGRMHYGPNERIP